MNITSITKSGNIITFYGVKYDGTVNTINEPLETMQKATLSVSGGGVIINYGDEELSVIAKNVTNPSNTSATDLMTKLNTLFETGTAGEVADIITGTPVKAVTAAGTLTISSGAPADGKTVTVGGKVYTFKTALTPTEGEVLINTTLAAALDNLKAAINHTGTPDTDYKCAAANTKVVAGTKTGTTLLCTYLVAGAAGNLDAPATNVTNGSWAWATGSPAANTVGVDATLANSNVIYIDTGFIYTTPAGVSSVSATTGWYKAAVNAI